MKLSTVFVAVALLGVIAFLLGRNRGGRSTGGATEVAATGSKRNHAGAAAADRHGPPRSNGRAPAGAAPAANAATPPPVAEEYREKQQRYLRELAAKEVGWAALSEQDREKARIALKKATLGD